MLLTNLYHPPQKENAKFLEYFEDYIDKFINEYDFIIVMGDFNFDLLQKTYYSEKLLKIIEKNGLKQMVNSATRITPNSQTLIDHVISNIKEAKVRVDHTNIISDHSIVWTTVTNIRPQTIKKTKIQIRSYKNYNTDTFQDILHKTYWNNNCTDLNYLASNLVTSIQESVNKLCPIQTIYINESQKRNEWINDEIKVMIKDRNRLYERAIITKSDKNWNEYKLARNKIVQKIRETKDQYFKTQIDNNRGNSKKLWKNLKPLLPNKKERSHSSSILFDHEEIFDSTLIANKFNQYFLTSINELVDSIVRSNNVEYIVENIKFYSVFKDFQPTSISELRKLISNIKNSSGQEDGISSAVLKDAFNVIGNRFLDVINASLQIGKVPKDWKTSVISPIQKIQGSRKCEDFRPINVLPIYEKILELVVKNQLQDYCEKNRIITDAQSGFRESYSCETALLDVCHNWYRAMDKKNKVLVVFLDFKRAFETINTQLLIRKLEKMGITGKVLQWFKDYLSNRYQKVKHQNGLSSSRMVQHGIPQGSVLGPILFIIFINDIVQYVKNCNIRLFADDTMLYIEGSNVNNMMEEINSDLANVHRWLCDNGLKINTNKCKYMLLQNRSTNINNIRNCIVINGENLTYVEKFKYLGVIIDHRLNFFEHADEIIKKISKKCYFLGRIGKDLSSFTKLLLYKSLIAPHVEYCITLLYGLPKYKVTEIQKIQNRCIRTILKCNRFTPIKIMLSTTNLMSINQRVIFKSLLFIHRILKGLTPSLLRNKIPNVERIHAHDTRQRDDIYVNRANNNALFKSVFSEGSILYNTLPTDLKRENQLGVFKSKLSLYVKQNFT